MARRKTNTANPDEARTHTLEVLDQLEAAILPEALEGDPRAIGAALNVLNARLRILGADKPATVTDGADVAATITKLRALGGGKG